MPRPIRIEYPNAFYHIMNRGRGRQNIFHGDEYFLSFLDCLSEVSQKFGAVIHAYCLMTNHYHLIIETPNANLSRIMRHINGIYTQRYNRLKKIDGSLFRGRFKAILIDADNYLLNLNRYIHRNPVKLVKNLKDYKWSSYPSYLNLSSTPKWLNKAQTLEVLAGDKDLKIYKAYIEKNQNDDFIADFYSKKNLSVVMGNKDFKKKVSYKISNLNSLGKDLAKNNFNDHISFEKIIKYVSMVFKVTEDSVVKRQIIRSKNNFPRKLAMYLCQIYSQDTLSQIQKNFNLGSVGAVSHALTAVKKELEKDKYKAELREIENNLYVIQ